MTQLEVRFPGLKDGPRQMLALFRDLDKVWGHARIGLCLTDAHLYGIARTSEDIAVNTGLHKDTVRRHLRDLEKAGRVVVEKKGRSVLYAAHPEWAERTNERLRTLTNWALENAHK